MSWEWVDGSGVRSQEWELLLGVGVWESEVVVWEC